MTDEPFWKPIPKEDDPDFDAKFRECLIADGKRLKEMESWGKKETKND